MIGENLCKISVEPPFFKNSQPELTPVKFSHSSKYLFNGVKYYVNCPELYCDDAKVNFIFDILAKINMFYSIIRGSFSKIALF